MEVHALYRLGTAQFLLIFLIRSYLFVISGVSYTEDANL